MNPIAYRTTSMAIRTLSNLSKARVTLYAPENIPAGAKIFVINHFTRLETFLLPYYLTRQIKMPIWSLAAEELFVGAFGKYLESIGAVSTSHPDRDRLIVKSLLTNEAAWMIFPEGRMVKSKKIIEKGRYIVSYAGGKHPPHTGAAALSLRTEFYRQRLQHLAGRNPDELARLLSMFNLESLSAVALNGTWIVPVNLTYYPLRSRVNILNKLAKRLVEDVPERLTEELMTEGAMLVSGVDIDIRFGPAIEIAPYLDQRLIRRDMTSERSFGFDDPLPCLKCMRRQAAKLTRRYMQAIYEMTTVNFDHVFASLVKYHLRDRIDLDNLSRRAFLAITRPASGPSFYRHAGLRSDQNHLLIADRRQMLDDFLSVAEDKGTVARDGGWLVRNRRMLGPMIDFDRARVDNPIAVMANEVEPLIGLRRTIRRLSWQPGFILRRRVAEFLLQQAEQEFEQDYKTYFIEGESKPVDIGRPVLIRGRFRRAGVVLSHGYMAAPAEVRALAEYLGRLGFCVYAPRLRGHGTAPEDLARCTFQDWIQSMEHGYLIMRQLCRRVVLGGFSTGAALALDLARRMPDIAGVFAVSTPMRLQDMAAHLAPVLDTWNRLMSRVRMNEARVEFTENHPEHPHINYLRNPISGVRELERLMDHVEPRLSDIKVPALVVQSQQDPVVNPKGSEQIFLHLGSEDKQYLKFNLRRHGILLGAGADQVHAAIGHFVSRVAADAPAADRPQRVAAAEGTAP